MHLKGLCSALFILSLWGNAQTTQLSQEIMEQRRALAASGQFLRATVPADRGTGSALAEAMDLDAPQIVQASLSGDANATLVASSLGVIQPRQGNTFALLSSGFAGTNAPEPGIDFGTPGPLGDEVILTLIINVPTGSNSLSFDFNFLSAEYPDFIGTQFNDTFTAVVTDDNGSSMIAFASVNSSYFFPASEQVAGGSGFDIFTLSPSGIDTEFGTGFPDAGLTDFTSITAPISSSSGTVTLTFTIGDLGDGILDSAVLIDNVSIANFTMIDPNPEFVRNGELIVEPDVLSEGGRVIRGATADGVTPVLLRAALPGSGMVTFTLLGSAGDDGSVNELGASMVSGSVTVPALQTNNGYRAFAVYTVPRDFNRGGDENLNERVVSIQVDYSGDNGSASTSTLPLRLLRPPLVFLHGLWSSPATWKFPLVADLRWIGNSEYVNYKETNGSFFSANADRLPRGIDAVLVNIRSREIAATQVDVIGHSMGGLLSRIWAANGAYYKSENFNQGDINRLFTLNTPHAGSPLGNLVVLIRETPQIGDLFIEAAGALGHPIEAGALDDLSIGSDALNSIPMTPVPGHAMVGTGGSDLFALAPGYIGAFYKLVFFFSEEMDLFQGVQHDFIVGRNSQEGGIDAGAQSIFGGLDSIHIFCTNSDDYSDNLSDLLNTSPISASFGFFPELATLSEPLPGALPGLRDKGVVSEGLMIETDVVMTSPGGTVMVTATPLAGVEVDRVLFLGPEQAISITKDPFQTAFEIPQEFLGEYQITAIGTNPNEDFFTSPDVSVLVQTKATIQGIRILPTSPVIRGSGSSRAIQVVGLFSDGVSRDISSSLQGTQYLANDPGVFIIDHKGVITAIGEGISTLVAINNGVQQSVNVTILPECMISPIFFQRLTNWAKTESVRTLIPFATCQ